MRRKRSRQGFPLPLTDEIKNFLRSDFGPKITLSVVDTYVFLRYTEFTGQDESGGSYRDTGDKMTTQETTTTVNYEIASDIGYTVNRFNFTATTEVDENANVYTTWTVSQGGEIVASGEGDYDASGAEDEAQEAADEYMSSYNSADRHYFQND